MGDTIHYILPQEGMHCLSQEGQLQVINFIQDFFNQQYNCTFVEKDIYFETDDQIEVYCSMEYADGGMFCKNCRQSIELSWIIEQVNEWYDTTPVWDSVPYFQCPHCKETLPGHQLAVDFFAEAEDDEADATNYHFGFARQFLSLWNPPYPFQFFNNKTMKALSELWGCPVFQIYSRL